MGKGGGAADAGAQPGDVSVPVLVEVEALRSGWGRGEEGRGYACAHAQKGDTETE